MKRISDEEIRATVADDLPVGIWVARAPGGELVYANNTFAEIMGIAARGDVAVGGYSEPYGICAPDGTPYPESRMPFVRALEERRTVVVDDIFIHRHDGERVAIRATARPFFDDRGEITHVMIAFIDITREAEAEKARIETEAQMRRVQRMESIGKLAGGVAHDFNNLMAAIKVVASKLALTEDDPRRQQDLQTIDYVTDRATDLTRALLSFSGRSHPRPSRISLNDVVASVTSIIERAFDRRIEVDSKLSASRDLAGNRAELEQVVMNLVVNARDAMPSGGSLLIRTFDQADDQVGIEVSDTGDGIDPEIRDRIFEPYFSTKDQGPDRGAGLGLATVFGIVDAHGGRITVEDNQPRGTTMRVIFPAATMSVPPEERVSTEELVDPVPGAGLVLVVDDEETVLRATGAALEALGYEVVSAGGGHEAMEVFAERHADLVAVVLDLCMPRLDGTRVFHRMRSHDPGVPVLLTTGYTLDEEAQALLDRGVAGFLGKPYGIHRLSQAVGEIARAMSGSGPDGAPPAAAR